MALFKKKEKKKDEFTILPKHIGIIMDGKKRLAENSRA